MKSKPSAADNFVSVVFAIVAAVAILHAMGVL